MHHVPLTTITKLNLVYAKFICGDIKQVYK